MPDLDTNSDKLFEDMRAYRNLKASPALSDTFQSAENLDGILAEHQDITDRELLISRQYNFWENFATAMIDAQMAYIGPDQERGLNKAFHSIEVGEGVALAFKALFPDAYEAELNYIRFRGHLHDGGRILNLSPEVLNDNMIEALGYRSPIEICLDAAEQIVAAYPEIGTPEEVAEAICYAAIANRKSDLLDIAKAIDAEIKVVGDYFYRKDIHNPIYLSGLHNFTAHHNRPYAPIDDPENYNGVGNYLVIDHLAKVVDMASACTGSAEYLDEIALYLLEKTKKGECEPSYTRLVLEGYGSGESIIERWANQSRDNGFFRVPEGKPDHINFQDFVKALNDTEYGKIAFPRFFGQWSSHPTAEDREKLKHEIEDFTSLNDYVAHKSESLPKLRRKRTLTASNSYDI
jgi:hypothetical protein